MDHCDRTLLKQYKNSIIISFVMYFYTCLFTEINTCMHVTKKKKYYVIFLLNGGGGVVKKYIEGKYFYIPTTTMIEIY